MANYLFKRFAGLIPLFLAITFVSFWVVRLAPGGPVEAKAQFNPKMSLEARQKLKELYGLDKPLVTQYFSWLSRLARLELGESFVDGEKVARKIGRAIPVTLALNGLALLVILGLGIPLGMVGALKKDGVGDRVTTVLVMGGFAMPTFWLALLLMSFFGVQLGLLPVSGLVSVDFEYRDAAGKLADLARHLVLPVAVASVTGLAGISRFMRASMLDVLRQNYIRTARAKGLSEKEVLTRHAFKNALLPILTLLGLSVPGLLGGSVIFESIFSIPGMGRLFYNGVYARDYPVIMGLLVLGAGLTLLGNFLADVSYAFADPRIRLGGKERA